jgi:hypothetical protein
MQQLLRCASRFVLSRRALWSVPRPFFYGRGQAARWLLLFCNQRDARARVPRNSPIFYFRIGANSDGKAAFASLFVNRAHSQCVGQVGST